MGKIDSSAAPVKKAYTPSKQPHHNSDKAKEFIAKIIQYLAPFLVLGLVLGIRFCIKSIQTIWNKKYSASIVLSSCLLIWFLRMEMTLTWNESGTFAYTRSCMFLQLYFSLYVGIQDGFISVSAMSFFLFSHIMFRKSIWNRIFAPLFVCLKSNAGLRLSRPVHFTSCLFTLLSLHRSNIKWILMTKKKNIKWFLSGNYWLHQMDRYGKKKKILLRVCTGIR